MRDGQPHWGTVCIALVLERLVIESAASRLFLNLLKLCGISSVFYHFFDYLQHIYICIYLCSWIYVFVTAAYDDAPQQEYMLAV